MFNNQFCRWPSDCQVLPTTLESRSFMFFKRFTLQTLYLCHKAQQFVTFLPNNNQKHNINLQSFKLYSNSGFLTQTTPKSLLPNHQPITCENTMGDRKMNVALACCNNQLCFCDNQRLVLYTIFLSYLIC